MHCLTLIDLSYTRCCGCILVYVLSLIRIIRNLISFNRNSCGLILWRYISSFLPTRYILRTKQLTVCYICCRFSNLHVQSLSHYTWQLSKCNVHIYTVNPLYNDHRYNDNYTYRNLFVRIECTYCYLSLFQTTVTASDIDFIIWEQF